MKILVATEGSRHALHAVKYAAGLVPKLRSVTSMILATGSQPVLLVK